MMWKCGIMWEAAALRSATWKQHMLEKHRLQRNMALCNVLYCTIRYIVHHFRSFNMLYILHHMVHFNCARTCAKWLLMNIMYQTDKWTGASLQSRRHWSGAALGFSSYIRVCIYIDICICICICICIYRYLHKSRGVQGVEGAWLRSRRYSKAARRGSKMIYINETIHIQRNHT